MSCLQRYFELFDCVFCLLEVNVSQQIVALEIMLVELRVTQRLT